MAGLNDEAQWIVLMGFIVSFSFFFLAIVLSQSTVVGQTTAEGVLEFPKNDIRDLREGIYRYSDSRLGGDVNADFTALSLTRRNAIVTYRIYPTTAGSDFDVTILFHYTNGVTEYDETTFY